MNVDKYVYFSLILHKIIWIKPTFAYEKKFFICSNKLINIGQLLKIDRFR